jgi:WD40 repeat protein
MVFISSTFKDMDAERDFLVRRVFPALRQRMVERHLNLVDVDLRWGVTESSDALAVCKDVIDECRPRFLCILGGRYGSVPPGGHQSITESEIRYAVLDRPVDKEHTWFFFRDPNITGTMEESWPGEFREPPDSEKAQRLETLKRTIVEAGFSPIVYSPRWDGSTRRLVDLASFGESVADRIWTSVVTEGQTDHAGGSTDPFDVRDAMEAFAADQARIFFPGSREAVSRELFEFARSDQSTGYLCLSGDSGSGKSTILGYLVGQLGENPPPDLAVVSHFVGATAHSSSTLETVQRISQELLALSGTDDDLPLHLDDLILEFPRLLSAACAVTDVTVILDGVDELEQIGQGVAASWLPDTLPTNARVIVSTRPGPILDELRARLSPLKELQLTTLTKGDADEIVNRFLTRYGKRMSVAEVDVLTAKAGAGSPLYLEVSLEELRTLGTRETLATTIAQLPDDVSALFDWAFGNLEDDDGFRDADGTKIGRTLVSSFASLLGASMNGLSELELVELLTPPCSPALHAATDQQGNVAALLHLLRPYLIFRAELIDFSHQQIRAAAEKRYLRTEAARVSAHRTLAAYFATKPNWYPQDSSDTGAGASAPTLTRLPNARRTAVLPAHLLAAGDTRQLTAVLTDLDFVEAKIASGQVSDLLLDYTNALDPTSPLTSKQRSRIEAFARFVRKEAHFLAATPSLTLQRAASQPPESAPSLAARRTNDRRPWLRRLITQDAGGASMTLTADWHLSCCSILRDGRQAVAGDVRGVLLWWDVANGRILATRQAHDGSIHCCRLSPDGRLLATAADDGFVRLWDSRSRVQQAALAIDDKPVLDCAFSPDGSLVYACTEDTVVKANTDGTGLGTMIPRGTGLAYSLLSVPEAGGAVRHESSLTAIAISPDGQTIVTTSGWVGTVKLGNPTSGALRRTLRGPKDKTTFHGDSIQDCDVSPDGASIAVAHQGSLELWELRTGRRLWTSEGDLLGPISSCAFSPDGRSIGVGTRAGAVSVLDTETGATRKAFSGHREAVTDVAWSGDGAVILSSSVDSTLTLWETGESGVAGIERDDRLWVVARANDGTLLARPGKATTRSSAVERPAIVLDAETRAKRAELTGPGGSGIGAASFSPDCTRIVTTGRRQLHLWETATGAHLAVFAGRVNDPGWCAYSPDGTRVLTRSTGRHYVRELERSELALWDVTAMRLVRTLAAPCNEGGFGSELTSFTPDGALVIARTPNQRLCVWDAETGDERAVISLPRGAEIQNCLLSPDGAHVVVFVVRWPADRRVERAERITQSWSVATGDLQAQWSANDYNDGSVFSPSGNLVVSWANYVGSELNLWDPLTGDQLGSLGAASDDIRDAVFSPDGRRLVCCLEPLGGGASAVEMWELPTGRRLGNVPGQFHGFSADGRTLLTVDRGVVQIWDVTEFSEVMRFVDDVPARGAAWLADGIRILVHQPVDSNWFWSLDTLGDQFCIVSLENWTVGPPVVTAWTQPRRGRVKAASPASAFQCFRCRVWNQVAASDLGQRVACSECDYRHALNQFTLEVDWRRLVAATSATSSRR